MLAEVRSIAAKSSGVENGAGAGAAAAAARAATGAAGAAAGRGTAAEGATAGRGALGAGMGGVFGGVDIEFLGNLFRKTFSVLTE